MPKSKSQPEQDGKQVHEVITVKDGEYCHSRVFRSRSKADQVFAKLCVEHDLDAMELSFYAEASSPKSNVQVCLRTLELE